MSDTTGTPAERMVQWISLCEQSSATGEATDIMEEALAELAKRESSANFDAAAFALYTATRICELDYTNPEHELAVCVNYGSLMNTIEEAAKDQLFGPSQQNPDSGG